MNNHSKSLPIEMICSCLRKYTTFQAGGGRAKLNADVMIKLNILLPTFDEQEKIGSFFKQLDNTIALHQRKLDLLKEQKKGFLKKMFV